jgi:pimeloyl-ACP methyl ester carboxylesterase
VHRCIALVVPLGGHSIALDGEPDLSLFGVARIVADFLEALELSRRDHRGQRHLRGGVPVACARAGLLPSRGPCTAAAPAPAARLRAHAARGRLPRHRAGRRAAAEFDRPARVVWAADDKFFPREHGRRLAELLARGSFELVENSRTFIPEDNPEALVESLRRFL